jgi:hypothetical protein
MKIQNEYYNAILMGDKERVSQLKEEMEKKATPRKISPIVINTILGDDDSTPIAIYNFLNEKFKDQWWDWEIETIEKTLWTEYGLVMSDRMAEKIQAIKFVINNQRSMMDWWYFNQAANSITGSPADFTSIKSPSPGMAIAAMRVMKAIRPEEDFSRDVKKYVCLILIDDGVYTPPPSVPELAEEMEGLVADKTIWPKVLEKMTTIIDKEDLGEEDNPIDIQARRLLIVERAADKFGG